MHTKEPRKDPLIELGYEKEDLNMKGVGKGTLFFFVFTFVCIFAGYWIFAVMNPDAMKGHQEDQPALMGKVPPEPMLQSNQTTKTDIIDLRANEENALKMPAYVDQAKGVVRIPIDRAIDLTVQRLQNPATNSGTATLLNGADSTVTSPGPDKITRVPAGTTGPGTSTLMPPNTPSGSATPNQVDRLDLRSNMPPTSTPPTPAATAKPSSTSGGTHTP